MGVVGLVEKQLADSLSSCSSSSSLFSPMCSPRVVNRAIYSIHAIEGIRGGGYRKRKGVVD